MPTIHKEFYRKYNKKNGIMRKLILIIAFILFVIIFTLIIILIGFRQNNKELSYLGLGLPLWFYLLVVYIKFLNSITVEKDYVIVKNPFFRKKIQYEEIEYWEENQSIRTLHRKLILKTYQSKRKIFILEDIDYKKYEMLQSRLKYDWKMKEIIYKY